MSLKLNIDVTGLSAAFKELAAAVEADLKRSVQALAAMTHAKVSEMAQTELHSSRDQLVKALGFEEVADGVWVVSIDEKALWIEEGIEPGTDMKPKLLKNAKTSPRGTQYKVIPFEHSKAPSQMTPYAQSLVSQIKESLKQKNIPFKKIEKDNNGNPRLGKLHAMDIPSKRPTPRADFPALKGLTIYQSKTASGSIRRDILTFRTVSSGPGSEGKWIHPGFSGKKFLDRALEWASNEWETNILPQALEKWK